MKFKSKFKKRKYLKCTNGSTLESQVCLEVLGNFTHKTLEWELADQQLCRFLVSSDLTQSHSSRPVSVGLLHTASRGGALTCSLGGQLFTGSLASSGFTSSLLGTSHPETKVLRYLKTLEIPAPFILLNVKHIYSTPSRPDMTFAVDWALKNNYLFLITTAIRWKQNCRYHKLHFGKFEHVLCEVGMCNFGVDCAKLE